MSARLFALLALLAAASDAAESLSLREALREAAANSPVLEPVRQEIRRADGVTEQTLAAFDPTVGGEAGLRESDDPQFVPVIPSQTQSSFYGVFLRGRLPTGTRVSVSHRLDRNELVGASAAGFASSLNPYYEGAFEVAVTQRLLQGFLWFPDFQTLAVAGDNREAARLQAAHSAERLLLSVAESYLQWAFAEDALALHRRFHAEAEGFRDRTREKVALGIQEKSDLFQAEATLRLREAEMRDAERHAVDARQMTAVVLGRRPQGLSGAPAAPDAGEWDLPLSEEEAAAQALERRRDLKAARLQREVGETRWRVAKSLALPSLDLTAGYGTNALAGSREEALDDLAAGRHPVRRIGLQVEIPLLNFEKGGVAKVEEADFRAAEAHLAEVQLSVEREARAAFRRHETARTNLKLARERRDLEERKLADVRRQYGQGRLLGRELLLHENDFIRAELALAAARQEAWFSALSLLAACGGLLEEAGVDPATLRPGG